MAEKIISGDSLQNEFVTKFNAMADEVNELKESGVGGGSVGAVVELSGDSGTLTDEQYAQCILPNTTIKWLNGSGGNMIYKPWRFVSPTYYFKSVYIDADECINNIIEIDQISHRWTRKSTAYSGGSQVSVTQTLTSGTKIGAITVDGKATALYAPEGGGSGGGGGSVPADAIIDVDKLPTEENAYLFQNGAKVEEYLMRKVVVHIVETLPEIGEPLLVGSPAVMNVYYQKGDDKAYSYLTPDVKPGYNAEGWTSLESGLIYINDNSYGGIVTDESQATNSDTLYLVYHAGEYINTQAIYRVSTLELGIAAEGQYIANGSEFGGMIVTIIAVDTLPDISELTPSENTYYIQTSDNTAWYYPNSEAGLLNIADMMGDYFGGIVSSKDQATDTTKMYVVYGESKPKLYHYKDGWHEIGEGENGVKISRFAFQYALWDSNNKTTSDSYETYAATEASIAACAELDTYIESNLTAITNIQCVCSTGVIIPVTLYGSGLYMEWRNGGISHTYTNQIEISFDGKLKMKSDDLVAGIVIGSGFNIVVTTV